MNEWRWLPVLPMTHVHTFKIWSQFIHFRFVPATPAVSAPNSDLTSFSSKGRRNECVFAEIYFFDFSEKSKIHLQKCKLKHNSCRNCYRFPCFIIATMLRPFICFHVSPKCASQHIEVCYYQIFMTIKMIIIHRWKFHRRFPTMRTLFNVRIAIERMCEFASELGLQTVFTDRQKLELRCTQKCGRHR